jgi:GNAT superfamily N-acetyltransferase
VPFQGELRLRMAGPGDARAIAALHADSWQRHYRGAFTDAFLDEEAPGYLLERWTGRLAAPGPRDRTIIAELTAKDGQDGQDAKGAPALVGLAHTVLDDDPAWGALLDNLHVSYGVKRHGVGTRLMARTARAVLAERPGSGLYLWVLEQNAAARAFYDARGGTCVESRAVLPPGGDPARLNGAPRGLRYAWPDPAGLLSGQP